MTVEVKCVRCSNVMEEVSRLGRNSGLREREKSIVFDSDVRIDVERVLVKHVEIIACRNCGYIEWRIGK